MQVEIPPIITIFEQIPEWPKARGKQYGLNSLLLLVVLGLLCGKKGPRGLARWGSGLAARVRQRLGFKAGKSPSAATISRLLSQVVVTVLEAAIAEWARQIHQQLVAAGLTTGLAIDGKSLRRAASLGCRDVHLLSAVCHQVRFVLKQVAVADKTNEISQVAPLLERLLLKGLVVTVDALLTQRSIAQTIRRGQGHYVLYAKDNQPKLLWAIRQLFDQPRKPGLPPPQTTKVVNGQHGRIEVRQIAVSPALNDYLDWPDVQQVFRLTRQRTRTKDGRRSQETVYGLTSLSAAEASPNQLIDITRAHWAAIENGIHWVRDVVMGEDACSVRTASAPQTFAALRNLAITLARLAGFDSITAAIDICAANPEDALRLLAL